MATINKKQLEEFKKIYKSNFGIELNNKEALEKALSLLNLVKITLLSKKEVKGKK